MTVLRAEDAEFYEKYAAELARFANTLGGPSGAEDLLLTTVLAVFASPRWPSVTNQRAYVYRALLNHAAKDRRSTQRRLAREVKAGLHPEVAHTDADLTAVEVRVALRALTVRQRAVVHLRYWSDLTVGDIARALQLPVRTVERELAAAKTKLEEHLR